MTSNENKLIEGLINQEEKTRGGMGKGLFQSRGRVPLWLRGFYLRELELPESLVMTYRAG